MGSSVTQFDINSKPLNKAKPCIVELLRDDGSIEWYEGCSAGQLLWIKSGNQKAYVNLDSNKVKNFNIETEESEVNKCKEYIALVEGQRAECKKKIEEEEKNRS